MTMTDQTESAPVRVQVTVTDQHGNSEKRDVVFTLRDGGDWYMHAVAMRRANEQIEQANTTDQTESEEPLTPAACVEYLDDIVANNAAGARNLAIPVELLSDSAAAIRALEAKVREVQSHNIGLAQSQAAMALAVDRLRADRDRLAGEVESLKDDLTLSDEHEEQAIANIARLTSELERVNVYAKRLEFANDSLAGEIRTRGVELAAARENEARWLWMFPDDGLVSVTERMQRVYRRWDGSDSWNAAVDAARRAGGEG